MRGRIIAVAALLILSIAACGKEDPNERANALFVEATTLFRNAANAKPEAAVSMYRDSLSKLDAIVARYPTSNLAVLLASGQPIGDISRVEIERRLLPGCDSKRARDTLSNVFNANKVNATRYDEIKTVSSTDKEVHCNASLTLKEGGTVKVDYRFFWEGSTEKVQYTITR